MKPHKIAVLPGDGIGPEIMNEALKVLEVMSSKYNIEYEIRTGYIGGSAIDRFETPLPEDTLKLCKESDAILLGSIGGPKWDSLPPEQRPELGGLLKLRKELKLYANIRPIILYEELKGLSPLRLPDMDKKIDLLTVRELASGIYFGSPKEINQFEAVDTMRYKKDEIQRIAKVAFEIASKRRQKVTSIDKANVLYSSMLWREVVSQVAKAYPAVQLEMMYVDNAAMQLILDPSQFDVILTTNLFGDILTDESAAICGSLGMLPSASLGESVHLYEPAGGSAPDIANTGLANPLAQILCIALMMEFSFKLPNVSRDINLTVEKVLKNGARTKDMASNKTDYLTTAEMGDKICDLLHDSTVIL
jgi:3-isopropylmalate dehydrogenase